MNKMPGILNIIVAFSTKNFGIGKDGKIPWNIPKDLAQFGKITQNSTIIMGRNTWESIPDDKKPLKNRFNVIVSSKNDLFDKSNINNGVIVIHPDYLDNYIDSLLNNGDVFIIGGEKLYEKYMGVADNIYATLIEKNYECDTFFPIEKFGKYEIYTYSEPEFSQEEQCNYRFIKYKKSEKKHGEYVYLDHMKNILDNGDIRDKERTGTGTKSLFGGQLHFDISESIPILTTKFVPFQLTVKELVFFLSGKTDSKILEAQGVNIWKANTSREFLDKRGLFDYEEGDLGSMYSFILCYCGTEYKGCNHDYTGQGINQLEKFVKGLKEDPWSRRHLMTTYCPMYADQGVLFPCHGLQIQGFYSERNNKSYLSLHVYIRSSDGFLGLPINILSYAILTYIIAKKCGYLPYELIISFGDRHIYNNHIDAVNIQLSKNPLPQPKLILNDSIIEKEFKDIELKDFELIGYLSNPKISAPMAI
jgi:dihydrofolate reductase/thymidylate synthase